MTQLAETMGLTPGAVSTLVDRLVDNGLVERRSEPADRRAVFVHLTSSGRTLLKEAQDAKHRRVAEMMRRLDLDTCRALNRTLGALLSHWEEALLSERPS
jgi:DNA-binding MarR family transcriptional regulator